MRIFIILILIMIGSNCNSKKDSSSTRSYPLSNFLDKCISKKKYVLKTVVDTVNDLKVDMPEDWDIQISNTSDLQGIFAMDTSILRRESVIHSILINSLNVKGYLYLDDHFKSELTGLRHDSIPIIEVGATIINNQNAFWVLTSRTVDNTKSKNLLVYTKELKKQKVLVISISISDSDDFKDQLCSFKEIIHSIVFLKSKVAT